jgi:hypothetical protein
MDNLLAELSLAGYSDIRSEYWAKIYDAVEQYLTQDVSITALKNPMIRNVNSAYPAAGEMAWLDGGAELPLDEESNAYISAAQSAELGYIEQLANNLRMLKKAGEFDAIAEAFKHAEAYSRSLDRLYNSVKVLAAGSKMLTFVGDDGKESCTDCRGYKGKRHKASWWVSHNAVPPNRDFECGGWQCVHILVDDNGNVFTL